jgi:hypothetical protein
MPRAATPVTPPVKAQSEKDLWLSLDYLTNARKKRVLKSSRLRAAAVAFAWLVDDIAQCIRQKELDFLIREYSHGCFELSPNARRNPKNHPVARRILANTIDKNQVRPAWAILTALYERSDKRDEIEDVLKSNWKREFREAQKTTACTERVRESYTLITCNANPDIPIAQINAIAADEAAQVTMAKATEASDGNEKPRGKTTKPAHSKRLSLEDLGSLTDIASETDKPATPKESPKQNRTSPRKTPTKRRNRHETDDSGDGGDAAPPKKPRAPENEPDPLEDVKREGAILRQKAKLWTEARDNYRKKSIAVEKAEDKLAVARQEKDTAERDSNAAMSSFIVAQASAAEAHFKTLMKAINRD